MAPTITRGRRSFKAHLPQGPRTREPIPSRGWCLANVTSRCVSCTRSRLLSIKNAAPTRHREDRFSRDNILKDESYTLQAPSRLPEATLLPPTEKLAVTMQLLWPTILNRKCPDSALTKFKTSPPRVAMMRPVGEKNETWCLAMPLTLSNFATSHIATPPPCSMASTLRSVGENLSDLAGQAFTTQKNPLGQLEEQRLPPQDSLHIYVLLFTKTCTESRIRRGTQCEDSVEIFLLHALFRLPCLKHQAVSASGGEPFPARQEHHRA